MKSFFSKVLAPVCLLSATVALAGCADAESVTEPSNVEEASQAIHTRLRVRKNVKDLSKHERRALVHAIQALKKRPSPYDPNLSYYDQFVAWHIGLYACARHGGHASPIFLPWHREFVLLFEDALREVSGKPITVPYWDWTDSESTDAVFQHDFMGGDGDPEHGYAVMEGPFRKGKWELTVMPPGSFYQYSRFPYLTRRFGTFPGTPVLPFAEEVEAAYDIDTYDVAPWNLTSDPSQSFRNYLEGFDGFIGMVCEPDPTLPGGFMMVVPGPNGSSRLHNAVHAWVGGSFIEPEQGGFAMGTMMLPTSPNDPVFFLHHANIDRIWSEWQDLHGVDSYEPVSGVPGQSADDEMWPYLEIGLEVTPSSVADIRALGYTYR